MRLHSILVCSALLLATPVFAQPGGGGRGGFGGRGFGGGVSGLVGMAEVQKELGITDEQKTEITKVIEESRPMRGAGGFNREEFQNLSEEERTKRFEEMRKQGEETAKKVEEKVKGVLNEQQWTRLSELRIQREGVNALSRAEVAEKLALSDEQKKEIAKLNEGLRPTFGRGAPGGGERPNFEEIRAQREKVQKDILAVLSEDQKETFEKMQGAKFEFPRPTGFGGGQGGGNRRPNSDNN